jgi:ribose transport system substrate-binding protein
MRVVRKISMVYGALGVAAALAVGACSSSQGSSSASGAPSSSAAANSGGVDQAQIAAAKITAPFLKVPTSINLPQLTQAPPKGKTIVWLQVNNETNNVIGEGLKAGAQLLGWHVTTIQFTPTPQSIVTSTQQAVNDNPDAIFAFGISESQISGQLSQMKSKHIAFIEGASPDLPGNGVIANTQGGPEVGAQNSLEADYILSKLGSKADIVNFNIPAYPILILAAQAFNAEVKKLCATCNVETINFDGSAVGTTLPQMVVSTLRANPSINAVVLPFGDASSGVSPAIAAANLHVLIVGDTPSEPNLVALQKGEESAWVAEENKVSGYQLDDAYARYLTGGNPALTGPATPLQLMVQSNVGNPPTVQEPPNLNGIFSNIWKVSG